MRESDPMNPRTIPTAFRRPFTPEAARAVDPQALIDHHRRTFLDASMAVIGVAPITLKDVDLKIGADNYEAHVHRVRLVPTVSPVIWKSLTPTGSYQDQTNPTWAAELAGAQDQATTNSLSQYLNDPANIGQQKTMVFKPRKTGTAGTIPTYTATVIIAPVPIGGDVDTVPTFEVTLGIVGAPVRSVT